jgi:hypothetical protein
VPFGGGELAAAAGSKIWAGTEVEEGVTGRAAW